MKTILMVLASLPWFLAAGCMQDGGGADDAAAALRSRALLGGIAGTVFDASSNAYRAPLPQLTEEDMVRHIEGDGVFESNFVSAPAPVNPGLGPLYNNTACNRCHLKEGRGSPVVGNGRLGSQMLIFVSAADGGPIPGIGHQVQDQAIFGATPNAAVSITWTEEELSYPDGTPYRLRKPTATIALPSGEAFPADAQVSLRQPLPLVGLGLLEAIPEAQIRVLVDAPGKVPGRMNVGRFGRKATKRSVRDQAGQAFAFDMGLTNPLFPGEQGETELDDSMLDAAAYYLLTLAVPARRRLGEPDVQRGESHFRNIGCNGCHYEEHVTGPHALAPLNALAGTTIRPYTDLLLHDMGEGLADGRPEFEASGSEWRTPALWGIGLTQTVHPYATYLHDGRARSLEEAILWHGGQAAPYREKFRNLAAEERGELVRFLESL